MKKILSLLVFAFLANSLLYAQPYWHHVNGPYGGNVDKIFSAPNGALYAINGSGIYRSSNDGSSWLKVSPSNIKDLTTGSAAPNGYIYAATGNYSSIIYRSTNEGTTWETVLPDGGYDFSEMTVTPSGAVLAGTSYMFSFHGQFIQSGDIYRSINNGSSFSPVSFPDLAIGSIKANINGDLYVATLNGLFKSVDNGGSWGVIRNDTCSEVFTSHQGYVFYASRGGIKRSTNNGGSWEQAGSFIPMASNPQGHLFSTDNGKIYRSVNNGDTWAELVTLSSGTYFILSTIHTKGNDKIFAGSDIGVYRSMNGGTNWSEANAGINITNIRTIAAKGSTIFAGSDRFTSRSTDNGLTWQNLSGGLPPIGASNIQISNDQTVFAFTFNKLYRSVNNGANWNQLTSLPAFTFPKTFRLSSNSELYVAADSSIYRSSDNGNTWAAVSGGLPSDQLLITGISLDSQNNVYVSAEWGGFNTQYGMFRSTNGGTSWTQLNSQIVHANLRFINGNMISLTVNDLMRSTNGGSSFQTIPSAPDFVIDLEIGALGQLFVHYVENEVYGIKRSTDGGNTWTNYTQGLGQLLVYDLEFDENHFLLAGTQSGLFKTNSTTAVQTFNTGVPSDYSLSQNYPNPFNPVTSIQYAIPEKGFVKLSVFDITGREISVLVNEALNAGTYTQVFDAADLSSGVYFYRLQTGRFSSTRKMIILK